MTLGTAASLAARSLRRSPLRAVLTGAGLIIGVVAITLSVASGEGARRAVMQQWRAMVGNLDALFVSPGGAAQRGMATMENSTATLTPDDAIAVRAGVPNVNDVAIEQSAFNVGVEANGRNGTTALLGVSPNWSALRGERQVRSILARHQQAVDSAWTRIRPTVHAAIGAAQMEIAMVLRPEQRERYSAWVRSTHRGVPGMSDSMSRRP